MTGFTAVGRHCSGSTDPTTRECSSSIQDNSNSKSDASIRKIFAGSLPIRRRPLGQYSMNIWTGPL